MKLTNPQLQSRLAAEYVLGSMSIRARRRFTDYLVMAQHRALRDQVAIWERFMTPLTEQLPSVTPSARVWQRIESAIFGGKTPASTRVFGQNAVKTPANKGLLQSFAFWRNLGLGASSLAAVLLVVLLVGNVFRASADPMLMAVLENDGIARIVVEQPKSGVLMVKMIKPWKPAPDNSMQLWVISSSGEPRSLGIVNELGETKFATGDMDVKLADGLVLALSREPRGGSPTGQPTGRILCKGPIAKMPPKQKPRPQI